MRQLILTGLMSLGLATPGWAQLCPENQVECNNRCIPMGQRCDVADDSNKFFLLGVVVAVGAIIGLGFYLNPDESDADGAAKDGPKAASPIDLSVTEHGGGLILRGSF